MSRFNLLFLFTIVFSINSNSQCVENAFGFGNNTSTPSYNITGDVSVTLNSDNTITLDLAENFSTASGPDVRAYLVKSNGMSDADIRSKKINELENIPIGLVSCSDCSPRISPNGAKSFTVAIPDGEFIEEFDKVFFYCLAFNAFWDVGSFNAFSNQSCDVLSTTENSLASISIYPNPATTSIEFNNIDVTNTEIHIFDSFGREVFYQQKEANNSIDVSSLSSGTYFLRIHQDERKFLQKLIIQ